MTSHAISPPHTRRPIWRSLGYGILSVGCGLLLISSLGEWSSLGDYASRPARSWERFDRALVDRTPTLEDLYDAANQRSNADLRSLPPQQTMQTLFDTASARFTHGESLHTPFSNWILWTLGQVHPALGAIRDPGGLLKRGESAFCGVISYVLMQMALQAGIRPRHVGLNGHVVMEAWYDGEWHMYDPDFEVVPLDDSGSVLSVAALSRNEGMIRKVYAGKSGSSLALEKLVKIMTSRDDNSFVSYPPGSQFEWKSQVLLRVEQAAEVLKFVIPAIMILLGGLILAPARKSRA